MIIRDILDAYFQHRTEHGFKPQVNFITVEIRDSEGNETRLSFSTESFLEQMGYAQDLIIKCYPEAEIRNTIKVPATLSPERIP